MSSKIQFRRGTAAALAAITPAQGEPCFTTDTSVFKIGDGTTLGGVNVGFAGTFAALTGKPTTLSGYGITDAQALDSDLTAIAALTTTSFGRSLLTQADAAATRATIGAGSSSFDGVFASLTSKPTTLSGYGITDAQPLDADLTAIAALATLAFGRSLLTATDAPAGRTLLGAGTSSFDGVFASLTSKPTTIAGYGLTDAQALNTKLTAIGALANASGALTNNGSGVFSYVVAGVGAGDFVGPGSATDNAVVRFDATTGKLGQNSAVILSDTGTMTFNLSATGGISLNATSGFPLLGFSVGGTSKAFFGVATTTDEIITGSVSGDFCVRGQASAGFLISLDNGSTNSLKMGSTGHVDINVTNTGGLKANVTGSGIFPLLGLKHGGVDRAFLAVPDTNGAVINGSIAGDFCFRAQVASARILLSADNGASVGLALSSSHALRLPAYTAGTLVTDASGNVTAVTSGAGTVTSVAMTVPAFLSVSGSPVTTNGTLAVSLAGALPIANGGTAATTAYGAHDAIRVHGADIASAATLNLDAATGDLVDVTGTTTITAITLAEGRERTVRFTGALTLTAGASLILPSGNGNGSSVTTAAGDIAIFRGYAAGVVRCVLYTKKNGALVATLAVANGGTGTSTPYTAYDNLAVQSSNVASAATLNIDYITATGNLVDVTGTTTITAITMQQGLERTVRFTGILILTNGASLVLPGGANITTAAGDFAIFRGYASSVVRCVAYTRASGVPVVNWFDQSVKTTNTPTFAGQTIDNGSGALPTLLGSGEPNLRLAGGTASPASIEGDSWATTGLTIRGRAVGGTRAAPSATTDALLFVNIGGFGYDTAYNTAAKAVYQMYADGLWSASNNGAYHLWAGTPNGSTTRAEWMRLQGGNALFAGSIKTDNPSGGTAQTWKFGGYTAGTVVQAGKVRVEINGVAYDLLTA